MSVKLVPLDETAVAVPSLEDVTARVVEHFARSSESSFDAGREVFEYMRNSEPMQAPGDRAAMGAAWTSKAMKKHRRTVLRAIAAGAGCSTNCIVQHVEVWAAFGEEGIRAEDKSWAWHRAVLNAAKRTKESVPDVLDRAITSGWSVADLNSYGRVESTTRRLVASCTACGLHATFKAPKGTAAYDVTKALACPVCRAAGEAEPPFLGTLVAA